MQVTAGIEPDAEEASRLILRRSGKMHWKAKLKTAVFEDKFFAQHKLLKKAHAVMRRHGLFL